MNRKVISKIEDFFSNTEGRTYNKGDIITHAHKDPEGVMFLVGGVVEQYDVTPEGSKIIANIFKDGSFFPMSWALNKTPNQYFFAALTDVEIKYADPDDVIEFLSQNPDVMIDLMARVYKGMDGVLRRLVLAASGMASSRLIFELLVEAYRFGEKLDNGHILVKIRQNSLASRSGLARETVNRELHRLKKEGLVALTRHGIEVDTEGLESRLDFNA